MNRRLILIVLALLPVLAEAAANRVANGDFSQLANGKPVAWEACGNARSVEQRLEAGEENGARFAKLVCTRCVKTDPRRTRCSRRWARSASKKASSTPSRAA
jgi:hypothetical protein